MSDGSATFYGDGRLRVTIDSTYYPYPTAYGLNSCTAHDRGLEPVCTDAVNIHPGTEWCFDYW